MGDAVLCHHAAQVQVRDGCGFEDGIQIRIQKRIGLSLDDQRAASLQIQNVGVKARARCPGPKDPPVREAFMPDGDDGPAMCISIPDGPCNAGCRFIGLPQRQDSSAEVVVLHVDDEQGRGAGGRSGRGAVIGWCTGGRLAIRNPGGRCLDGCSVRRRHDGVARLKMPCMHAVFPAWQGFG